MPETLTAPPTRNRVLDAACALDGRPKYLIAAVAMMPPNTLGGIISGRLDPTPEQRSRIAAALGTTVDALFGNVE